MLEHITDRIGGRHRRPPGPLAHTPRVAILGAGVGGLCMGIQLERTGIESFTIYEKSDGVGGTWRDNTYPGASCDVPSHFYSFSFAPYAGWSRVFAEQPEILQYLEHCANRFGLRSHLRLGTAITEARFDESAAVWRLRTSEGEEIEADVVVSGLGQLNVPAYPGVPGREEYAGTAFHSARWNHEHDLRNERVAVIGNAASAIQFVPRIAPHVEQLFVYQRSPNWILPKPDVEYPERAKRLFRRMPLLRRLHRAQIYASLEARWFVLHEGSRMARKMERTARDHLEQAISDPVLREKLLPVYPIGCKRMLMSNDYYETLTRPDVELVTTPIERFTADGITSVDGAHRCVDTIIYATGFEATNFLSAIEVVGRDGRRLHDTWRDGAEAYLGMTVTGFPNFFMLYGPNTNLGTNSIMFMIECQVRYVLRCLDALRAHRHTTLEARRSAMDADNRDLQRALHETVWEAGCHNWYKTESGKVTNNWPRTAAAYRWRTRRPDLTAFDLVSGSAHGQGASRSTTQPSDVRR